MALVTTQQVEQAYETLASADKQRIQQYWADDMRWLAPGHNLLSGWKNTLDEFLNFMATVARLSGHSFHMDRTVTLTGDDYSIDVNHNVGYRAGHTNNDAAVPYTKLDIDVIHLLRWRDGKVIEGRGAIFGDGTTQYDQFWWGGRSEA
jgi:ketosteroid isomerase-like protein